MNRNGKTVRDHMQAWNEAGKGCKEQSGSTETESYKTDFFLVLQAEKGWFL